MHNFTEPMQLAFSLILSADSDLLEIILLSLRVSLLAVFIACCVGLPLGAFLAISRFPLRKFLLILISSLMGLPPVVIGLVVYMMLSQAGPLGWLQLLYTPKAMIIAQIILILPIITALTQQIIADLYQEYQEQLRSLNVSAYKTMATLLIDARYSLVTVILAGFGRAIAEVGAVMIVGGNINHLTRVMTTSIALETSKGDLALALALGIVLLSIALLINAGAITSKSLSNKYHYA
jgi:tungstate transport system permease protein